MQPDTATATGRLAFTRELTIPSLVLSLGFATNPDDRAVLLERSYELAQGLFSGLLPWSRSLIKRGNSLLLPSLPININGQSSSEQGLMIEGNAYVPVALLDQYAIDVPQPQLARWLNEGGIAYIRAIDLREAGVCVGWEPETGTALLRTLRHLQPDALGNLSGVGQLQPADYEAFLQPVNLEALRQFPEVAPLYQEEAAIEGINPDVAFAQALVATHCFGFSSLLQPAQNNFGGLGAMDGSGTTASFPSARIGIRAQIQHLKAYANEAPLVQDVVDPRFPLITRGVAPTVAQLSRRWSADADYGEQLLAIVRRLYESAGLL